MSVTLDLMWKGSSDKIEMVFDRVPIVGEWIWRDGVYLEVQRVVWESRDPGLGNVGATTARLIVKPVSS